MQQLLKQSTAATTIIGPVMDSTGAAYTGLVIGDLNITKNGTTAAMASAATVTHDHNGHYLLVFTTGNTDTLGRLDITCNKATYAMPPKVFEVLAAAPFDTLVTNGTLASMTSGRTAVVDANGLIDANTVKLGPTGSGTAQTARDIGASVLLSTGTGTGQLDFTSGVVKTNVTQLLGTAWLTPGTAGTPDVNAKLLGGTSQTGRDIGASVLLSTGTGTGQLDFTSGVVKANATQWLGGTIPAVNVTGVPLVDAKYLLGTIFATPNTAGLIDVNTKQAGAVAWGSAAITAASIATGAITNTKFAAGAIDAAAIADAAIDRATFAADTGLVSSRSNTAQAGGNTSITLDASASATTDFYKYDLIYLTGGTGNGQYRLCTAYNGSTKVATVTPAWATNPDNTSTFAVLPEGIVDVETWLATAVTAASAGVPDVNAKQINAVATTSVTTINAHQGTTNAVNFTGSGASGYVKSDMVDIAGAAVSTSTAQIGVNAVNIGGTAQTGRDLGASVLIASGTGTGQLDVTSGRIKADTVYWNAAAVASPTNAGYPLIDIHSGTGTNQLSVSSGQVIIQAGSGTGQLDFTSGVVKTNVTQFGGSAGTFASGRPEVNSTHFAGTISAGTAGYVALDWAHITGQSTSQNLSGTTINLVNTLTTYTGNTVQTGDAFARLGAPAGASIAADLAEIESETDGIAAIPTTTPLTAAQIATGIWQDTTAGDFTVASSVGKALYVSNVAPGGVGGHLIAGSNAATTFATLTSTGAFSINGVSDIAQTGDNYARIGAPAGASVSADIAANLTATRALRPRKNIAITAFPFKMVLATDHTTGATGVTITATRSLDGAAFAACANSVSEVGGGIYRINLLASDLNGDTVVLRFAASGCDTLDIGLLTQST